MSSSPRRPSRDASASASAAAYERLLRRFEHLVRPRVSGMPSLVVLLWFPVLVVVVTAVLVVLGVSGSSTGVYWQTFGSGVDPDLIAGTPRNIRSDEWLVQSSWIVSQTEQGFPLMNGTLPGGMDATIQNDLPVWDWSSAFRPHVLGLLLFPLDQGMAVRWWLPAVSILVSAYLFVVSLAPRRPVTAALLAVALLLSPLLQWWFLPTTLWPVAWAFTVLTALRWSALSSRRWVRWGAAAVAGYLTVTLAMSIYVPFMVPAVLVTAILAIGFIAQRARESSWAGALREIVPLVGAAVAAVGVLLLWVVTRFDTVAAVLGTVYPGERLEATGAMARSGLVALFGAPFQRALQYSATGSFGPNASESAAPFLLGFFLLVPLGWFLLRTTRRFRDADRVIVALFAANLLVFAFLLVPNWDAIAHLILIDRTTVGRVRLAFDVLSVVSVAVLANRLDALKTRAPWPVAVGAAGLVLASALTVWFVLRGDESPVLGASAAWRVVAVVFALSVLFAARRSLTAAAGLFLVATVIVAGGVNPLYRGVFELTETQAGEVVEQIEDAEPDATWVGVGSYIPTAVLVQSGVDAYNGVQTYPPEDMWREIDPEGVFENEWNRLANVNWTPGEGEPVVMNPVRDQILVSFDACSEFAATQVDYVLSDVEIGSECLTTVAELTEGASMLRIYEVR